jgi:hypothetical protein
MTYREWISPRKLREHYVDHAVPDVQEANKQLFLAVAAGVVRARCQGVICDPRWFRPFAFDDSNPNALPPDVELSVKDAQQKWGDESSHQVTTEFNAR